MSSGVPSCVQMDCHHYNVFPVLMDNFVEALDKIPLDKLGQTSKDGRYSLNSMYCVVTVYCKSFKVEKFHNCKINWNSLESIRDWTVVLYGQSILHRLFQWKSFAGID